MAVGTFLIGGLVRGAGTVLAGLLPGQCLRCGAGVEESGRLCAACWSEARFLVPPHCHVCGLPFEYDPGEAEAWCANCLRERPVYESARSALAYEGVGRDLVLGFKLSDRTYAAPALARWMARAGAEFIERCDVLAPVPLHRHQLFLRRYNQAALLAHALGRIAHRPVLPDLLRRTRRTARQSSLSAPQRAANVRGAFTVRPRLGARIEGRSVLLVDDVLTTGATVDACARALRAGGASHVFVLTLARTLRTPT